jgi:hypothetical protein
MEKQRDKQARRMQRKLNREAGIVEGEDGAPVDESLMQDDAAEPDAPDQNPDQNPEAGS